MHKTLPPSGLTGLRRAATAAYLAIAAGQIAFLVFLLGYYLPRTVSGDFARWNDKPLIDGHIPGDDVGNAMFALHVSFAAVITLTGLIQPIPAIRARVPRLHRWSGRTFLVSAVVLALGGLWQTWIRGSYVDALGSGGTTLNAFLILGAGAMALRMALARRFAEHRRWALRLFILAGAVWFIRIFYMAWALATGGAGIGDNLDGPFDLAVGYLATLLPLAITELYLRAEAGGSVTQRRAVTALLALSVPVILGGSIGAWLMMWSPYF
jgi:Predicted membrane protein (DUF2306)